MGQWKGEWRLASSERAEQGEIERQVEVRMRRMEKSNKKLDNIYLMFLRIPSCF
jgi:hypothetical protein